MAKKSTEKHLKPHEKAWMQIHEHHMLGPVSSEISLLALEDNSSQWAAIDFPKGSIASLKVINDTRCQLYIRKENKLSQEEWLFVFATVCIYLGLELYKKTNTTDLLARKGLIIFAIHYVKNNLGLEHVPQLWHSFFDLENIISFKNEKAVIDQLVDDKKLLDKAMTIGFVNSSEHDGVMVVNEKDSGLYWRAVKSFSEIFVDNLVKQAQKTIALRSNQNLCESELKKRNSPAYKAKQWFTMHYPLLAALSASFEVIEDIGLCKQLGIDIAAVSAMDKIIYVNPLANLNDMGLRFVIAHEILHVALNHAYRRAGRDHLIWNLACDFVINQWLVEMNVGICPEGLFLDKSLTGKSADEIYLLIASDVRLKKKMMTLKDLKAGNSTNKKSCDMLDDEPSYYSDFAKACKEALLRGMFLHQSCGRGELPADLVEEIKAINQPVIPWQVELAQWIAQRFPLEDNKRSYARPSRRQSSTPDIPRASYIKPEYDRQTRTFGVILDTSASMDRQLLGKCLGAIASYSMAQEVKEVRLICCDVMPHDEGFVAVELLAHKFKVRGRGGTQLQQAVNYLENALDFPDKAPILVLTDGFFESNLKIQREHAFLVPNKAHMPMVAKNVFEFK